MKKYKIIDSIHPSLIFEEEVASDNTIFTHRAICPSVRTGVRSGFGEVISVAEKFIQPDTPAPPNRIAAGTFGALRWWGVVNKNVIRNSRK
ncbi:hypothetical protein H70357_21930 [Paenibacillus sp. FSL H7-0357]|nr:hypothetical protein H70357_21930 [Paenibacillus sp. FSL H7-0357]